MSQADYRCPECRGALAYVGEDRLKCGDCGVQITEAQYIGDTAEMVRAEGFDELADRLEAAAEAAREAENGA